MKASEIRATDWRHADVLQTEDVKARALVEIAAQLAELNENATLLGEALSRINTALVMMLERRS